MKCEAVEAVLTEKAATGVAGLDDILRGGFPRNRMYLVEGSPGTGKTTLGLQFLMTGRDAGERCLYFSLSETRTELEETALSHGWDLDGIEIHELIANEAALSPEKQYTVFEPSEVELGETVKTVIEEIHRVQPSRVVFDSLSEMRLLAQSGLRYRRQILALKHFFSGIGCTVLLLDDKTAMGDEHVMSLAHGVLYLEILPIDFGIDRRRLRIAKLRAIDFNSGYHDFRIMRGGLQLYPRLGTTDTRKPLSDELVSSDIVELDNMLHGGLARGTSTLIMGPAGSGKSSLVSQYIHAACVRGERTVVYVFEENLEIYRTRAIKLGMHSFELEPGCPMTMRRVDPAELSPGEFIAKVRDSVVRDGTQMVVIDSLNGLLHAMPGERQLLLQLHELFSFLGHLGVTTLITESQHGMMGAGMKNVVDVSYLADTVIMLRYFEAYGKVRQAISTIKKRAGGHERTIREFKLGPSIRLGDPLHDFHGVLSGIPEYVGESAPLLESDGDGSTAKQ